MCALFVSQTATVMGSPPSISLARLLERGIEYIRQRQYAEGLALLTLAAEQPSSAHTEIRAMLKALQQEYTKFQELHRVLQEISTHLIETQTKLQTCGSNLQQVVTVLSLEQEVNTALPTDDPATHTDGLLPSTEKLITFHATCLGPFTLQHNSKCIQLCANRNAQAMLRYLITQPGHGASADKLMDMFWPDDDAETATRKLQVTISLLRRSLLESSPLHPASGYILRKQRVYLLNPEVTWQTDVEEFLHAYQIAQQLDGDATAHYELACSLYTRPFLMEDLYTDWSQARREQLRQIYLNMCSSLARHYLAAHIFEKAAHWALVAIDENRCNEDAHRLLMLIYAQAGKRTEALRQYQFCQKNLDDELGLHPMPETIQLYQRIIAGNI